MADDKKRLFPSYYKIKETPGRIKEKAVDVASADVGAGVRRVGAGAGKVLRYPVEVARGKGVVLRALGRIVKFVFLFFVGLIIIVAGLLVGLFAYNYFYKAGGGASILKHAGVGLEEVGVAGAAKLGVISFIDIALNPEKAGVAYGFESKIDEDSEKEDLGVKITKLEQVGGRVLSGEDIVIRSVTNAKTSENELMVNVMCSMEGYKGNVKGEISGVGGDSIRIYKDIEQTFTATCKFPGGIVIDDLSKIKETKIAKMTVSYNFITKAMHNTYFLNKRNADYLLSRGQDPFVYYNIRDTLLRGDRTVRSVGTKGPINLGIGTYDSQPFSEGVPYVFGVTMTNNNDWFGNLKELTDLSLYMPPNIKLGGEGDFIGDCNFHYTGSTDQYGFKVYNLNSDKVEQANKDCSKEALVNQLMTGDECLNFFKDNLNYMCKFMVVEGLEEDVMFYDLMRAEAGYIYETSRKVAVDVYNVPIV